MSGILNQLPNSMWAMSRMRMISAASAAPTFAGFYRSFVDLSPALTEDQQIDAIATDGAKVKPEFRMSEDLRQHFHTHEQREMLATYPKKILRKKQKSPEHLYLADALATQSIVPHLLHCYSSKMPIVEVNPGTGILTQELLKHETITDLRLFESHREFLPLLVNHIYFNHNYL